MGEAELQIILPPRDEDALSEGLRELTAAISEAVPGMETGYGLGGENGYGVNYENSTFMMHRYCWCDKPDCLWCTPWLSNDTDATEEDSKEHRAKQHAEAIEKYGPWIVSIGYGAPHFWHKPSGFQMVWYKWIGRDNKTSGARDVEAMIAECIRSLPSPPTLKAKEEVDGSPV